MLNIFVPPKPFMYLNDFSIFPSKSPMSSDMHADARLSIPQGRESVSNGLSWSNAAAWADIATAENAKIAISGFSVLI
jgi:hypothetical protein